MCQLVIQADSAVSWSLTYLQTNNKHHFGEDPMTTTSALAKETFSYELEAAKKYDDDQYVYVVGEARRMFNALVAEAAIVGTFHEASQIFEDLTANPDNVREDGIRIIPTAKDVRVLAIPDGTGNDLLYTWEIDEKRGHIRLFKTKPPIPPGLRSKIDMMINEQHFDLDVLQKAKDMAAPFSLECRGQYVDPDDITGVIESINERGLEKAKGNVLVYGSYYNTDGLTMIRTTIRHNSSLAAIERVAEVLGTENADRDCLREEVYLDFLQTGTVREQEDSVAALLLETVFERKMGMIKEIVAASEFLELGIKTYVSHGDYDREVYVHRASTKDIYVHNNIDRLENVYLLALNGEGSDYHSVDIHISKPWYATLHSNEIYDDEAMDWETLASFISYQDENGGTLREDQVVHALLNDEKPGLVGSYSLKTGEFTRGAFFENTTVLDYLSTMIDIDHHALTNGIKGDLDEIGTFAIKTRDTTEAELGDEEQVDINAWLEKIGKARAPSI